MNGDVVFDVMKGAISYHDHYGWERGGGVEESCRTDYHAIDLARSAKEYGFRGVVLRNLYFTSAADAELVERIVPDIELFGGMFLNAEIGGINAYAVDTLMTYAKGLKFVCGATDSCANNARKAGISEDEIYAHPMRYITPFERDGSVKKEMIEILENIARHDIIYETGSLTPEENIKMVRAARDAGCKKIVVTHPTPYFCGMTMEQAKQCIDMGAYIEFTWMFYSHAMTYMARKYNQPTTGPDAVRVEWIGDAFDQIRELGAEHCILSTDLGTVEHPYPVEGLRQFIFCLMDIGMSREEIELMIKTNLYTLLNLS